MADEDGGISSLVVRGRPMGEHLAFALAMPERTRARIMASSSWLKTPAIWRKGFTHGVGVAAAAINGDAAHDHEAEFLLPDGIDDLA